MILIKLTTAVVRLPFPEEVEVPETRERGNCRVRIWRWKPFGRTLWRKTWLRWLWGRFFRFWSFGARVWNACKKHDHGYLVEGQRLIAKISIVARCKF